VGVSLFKTLLDTLCLLKQLRPPWCK